MVVLRDLRLGVSVQGSTGYKIFPTKETNQRAAERVDLDKYEELYSKVKGGDF